MPFLPITYKDMQERGWSQPDFILVTGDAYVDHPSFGTAIISRLLEAEGFKVCIISQPQKDSDYLEFGAPKLGFLVNSGNLDCMVNAYTSAKKPRSDDAYSPGGKSGFRPDRALIVYCNAIRRLFGEEVFIAIGGLEASLRRFAHYDYWSDSVMPSILVDTKADILAYGMGEHQMVEIAKRLKNGEKKQALNDILGTCYLVKTTDYEYRSCAECPSFELVSKNDESGKKQYAISAKIQHREADSVRGKTVIQRHFDKILVQLPPAKILTTEELDRVYDLPYERTYHPVYEKFGGVPAIEEVKFSITHVRGCFGACNFCSLAYHQGRMIAVRSKESIIKEAKKLIAMPDFKGYIHDVGGPTANFRHLSCEKQKTLGLCADKKCLAPKACPNLYVSHQEYLDILREIRALKGVKKVFVRSGIRFDYIMQDKSLEFFEELVKHHVSGQLKVAPEHCSNQVLGYMGKPNFEVYLKFKNKFYELTKKVGLKQYLVPYLMSSHPGSTSKDAIELALFLKKENLHPQQVQDFYPTPGTLATAMYYTGLNPLDMKPVYVAKTAEEKREQRVLLQFFKKENQKEVYKILIKLGRRDLIGSSCDCLIDVPKDIKENKSASGKANTTKNSNKKFTQKTQKNTFKTGKKTGKKY